MIALLLRAVSTKILPLRGKRLGAFTFQIILTLFALALFINPQANAGVIARLGQARK